MAGNAAFEHGGNIYAAARELGLPPAEVLDFSANINPLGLPPGLQEHLAAHLGEIVHYPEPEAASLRQALAEHCRTSAEQLIVGNGAAELLYLLCQVQRPRRVLVTAPTFSEYEKAALAAGAAVHRLPLAAEQDFTLPWGEVPAALAEADLFFLCNPNNPTGTLLPRTQVLRLAREAAARRCFLVVDESFQDFLSCQQDWSILPNLAAGELPAGVAVLRSLTKFYAIPGLRLGFLHGPAPLIRSLEAVKDTWNVNCLAQRAGLWALGCREYQEASRAYVAEAKEQLYRQLAALPGVRPCHPSVNYLLLDMAATGLSSAQWRRRLRARGILVRDCANYAGLGDCYIRVAVRRPEENSRLVAALAAELAALPGERSFT